MQTLHFATSPRHTSNGPGGGTGGSLILFGGVVALSVAEPFSCVESSSSRKDLGTGGVGVVESHSNSWSRGASSRAPSAARVLARAVAKRRHARDRRHRPFAPLAAAEGRRPSAAAQSAAASHPPTVPSPPPRPSASASNASGPPPPCCRFCGRRSRPAEAAGARRRRRALRLQSLRAPRPWPPPVARGEDLRRACAPVGASSAGR